MNNYIQQGLPNLYSRPNYESLAYSDGQEAEARILRIVSEAKDRSTFSQELLLSISDWASEYHLSRVRHSLIRPLGIKSGDKVLELGCGCGAITRFLGELGAEVTAVEGSEMRAYIAATRSADLKNVRVIAEDLTKLVIDETFDWVLLIGVLEYAPIFSPGESPAQNYLKGLQKFLTPNGNLVIAIENKLGLKYFNGCDEDHLSIPFYGVQGLYAENEARTYGKEELKEVLKTSGFPHTEFLYPFPDYKLPQVVITEEGAHEKEFVASDLLAKMFARNYGKRHHPSFSEPLVWRELANNNLLDKMSNSFLVVASSAHKKEEQKNDVLAFCYAVNRVRDFTTETLFIKEEKIKVIKKRLFTNVNKSVKVAHFLLHQTIVEQEDYIFGHLALLPIVEARARNVKIPLIIDLLCPWFDYLCEHSTDIGKRNNLADYVISGKFMDVTPFNLVQSKGGLCLIDEEWQIEGDIPLGWVVFRSICSIFYSPGFEHVPFSFFELLHALSARKGLSVSTADFMAWGQLEKELHDATFGRETGLVPLSKTSEQITPAPILINQLLAMFSQKKV